MDQDFVAHYLQESEAALRAFREDAAGLTTLGAMGEAICASLRAGGKLLVCGNGGSAGDAQHIAGEFVSRLMYDRAPLAAIALTTDSSVLTATGNDYGYEQVFERQVRALGRPGDVLLGISTSGRSPNVLRALEAARAQDLLCLGFAGAAGMEGCGMVLAAPSSRTAIIQQIHIVAAHILCALVERRMFPRG
jgi:D-sedoheptulose 7-phosphate isomerase